MLKIHSEPPKPELPSGGMPLFALGFRPFFLAAAIAAALLILLWIGVWSGGIPQPGYYGSVGWHTHEMLFGYSAAVIAGFLLTAVRNWTGVNTPVGRPLALLVLLWLMGRLLPFIAMVIPAPLVVLVALVDLAFLPAVALVIRPALWQGKQRVNRIFVPLLLLMALCNLLVHLEALDLAANAARGSDAMLYLVVFLVALIGGRVIPFFTEAAVPGSRSKRFPRIEAAAAILLGLLVLEQLLYPDPRLTGMLALGIAATQSIRIAGWHQPGVWRLPILWVLYSGLIWIVTGFLLLALSTAGLAGINLAKHALAVGGVGIITFGMMARVALGHTGRPLQPARVVEIAFILLNLATLTRVFAPILLPERYMLWIHLSGGLWIVSFLIFSGIYLPILLRPRVDGKAG